MDRQRVTCERCGGLDLAETRLFGLPLSYCATCGYAGVVANGLAIHLELDRDGSALKQVEKAAAEGRTMPYLHPDNNTKSLPSARQVFKPVPAPVETEHAVSNPRANPWRIIPCQADCPSQLVRRDRDYSADDLARIVRAEPGWTAAIDRQSGEVLAYCPRHSAAYATKVVHD